MRYVTITICCCLLVGFLEASGQFRLDDTGRTLRSGETANERSLHLADGRRVPDPDTTTPSRYYPLHVGDAWEYDIWGSPNIFRREITGEIMLGDTLYYKWYHVLYEDGIPISSVMYHIRYDEETAFVKERIGEIELAFAFAPCPLNADFDTIVDCDPFEHPSVFFWATSGTYDGEIVFDESGPGTGGDTVRTSVKHYANLENPVEATQYAAGIGQVYIEYELGISSISYSRVDGEEHGVAVIATGAEPDVLEALHSGITLSVFPNPVRDHCSLEIALDRSQTLTANVYDVRGRRVLVEELGELGSGTHIRPLDFSRLAAGSYVVRVFGAGFQSSTVLVSKVG